MMKKLVALLMALALLCTSIGAFATEEVLEAQSEETVVEETAAAETTEGTPHTGAHTPNGPAKTLKEATCLETGLLEYTCKVCKQLYTEEIPMKDHVKADNLALDSKAPTCSVEGWQEFKCAYEAEPGVTHTFKVPVATISHEVVKKETAATCTTPKTIVETCKNCTWTKTVTEGEALGHVWTDTEKGAAMVGDKDLTLRKEEPATCKAPGYIANYYYCAVCGAYSDKTANEVTTIDQLKHDFEKEFFTYEGEDEEKVCVGGMAGKVTVTDKDVDVYVTDSTNQTIEEGAKGCIHYELKVPTCTEDGYVRVTCAICGDSKEETLKAFGHVWEKDNNKSEPNCVTDGKEVYECTVCHETYQNTLKNLGGHVFDEKKGSTVEYYQKNFLDKTLQKVEAPVLCNDYIVRVYCATAGCKEYQETEKAGNGKHVEGKVLESKAATCTEDGYKLYQCANCDTPVWAPIAHPKDHAWDNGKITTAPTCFDDGVMTYTCTVEGCGATKTEAIPTAGHTKIVIDQKVPTCTAKGWYEEKCAACGTVIVARKEFDVKHTYNLNKEAEILHYVAPTCTGKGEVSYYCTLCHELVEKEVIDALDHDWTEWTVTKEPTCEHVGEKQRTCNRCYDKTAKNPVGIETVTFGQILPHVYEEGVSTQIITKVATCTVDGEYYYSCVNCGKMDPNPVKIEALGHDYYNYDESGKPTNLNIVWDEKTNTFVMKCTREDCGYVKTIEVHNPEYTITTKGSVGTITLKEDCQALSTAYVRIMWKYEFKSGETFTYIDCREVKLSDDGKTGTFKVTGGSAGTGKLLFTSVEVVDDEATADMIMGTYTTYGDKLF